MKYKLINFTFKVFFLILLVFGCKKVEPERMNKVSTGEASEVGFSTCLLSGKVLDRGAGGISEHGFCYSESPNPDIDNSDLKKLGVRNTIGDFSGSIIGLRPGVKYYFKAFLENNEEVVYGDQQTFTTEEITIPIVETVQISQFTQTSGSGGGVVISDGGSPVQNRGVCWNSSGEPNINDSHTFNGSGEGSFISEIDGLVCNTKYYVRAYATNAMGTGYGSQVSFTTAECPAGAPQVVTAGIIDITENSAQCGGTVTSEGTSTVTMRGVCYGKSPYPTLSGNYTVNGGGKGTFISILTGLDCGTLYYVRAYAVNSTDTTYGAQDDFTTSPCAVFRPTVVTYPVSDKTENSAACGGNVTDDGGSYVTARGVCWNTSGEPTIYDSHTNDGVGTGSYTSYMTGLYPGETYYVRAYATNNEGTSYGAEMDFETLESNTVTDIDGNVYQTVQIGSQIWMAENLKVTHYADGSAIPLIESSTIWENLEHTDKAYSWYNNNTALGDVYGGLYTWAAAMNGNSSSDAKPSGIQGVCPDGWHLPSDAEWKQLEIYLGMSPAEADNTGFRGSNEGGMLKEAGTSHWVSPNTGATNSSGFTALPGGYRYDDGTFNEVGYLGLFWTATEYTSLYVWRHSLAYDHQDIRRFYSTKKHGFSVRCIKD